MARRKHSPVDPETARLLGGLLRELRKRSGYRSVRDAALGRDFPAAPQTIYAYERGRLVPSLPQLLDLVEFYVREGDDSAEQRALAVSTVYAALSSDAYHVSRALGLARALLPDPSIHPSGRT